MPGKLARGATMTEPAPLDLDAILASLKDFQHASVEYLLPQALPRRPAPSPPPRRRRGGTATSASRTR
jgi:hypothetical protein